MHTPGKAPQLFFKNTLHIFRVYGSGATRVLRAFVNLESIYAWNSAFGMAKIFFRWGRHHETAGNVFSQTGNFI
jgi:hypothetical protein